MKYDFLFCVLCYQSVQDLDCYLKRIKNVRGSYRVVVVESIASEEISAQMEALAVKAGADFFTVPNRGYGAGNNAGIAYAIEKYDFRFLVVTNADIDFLDFDIAQLDGMEGALVGPSIRTVKGKKQNPYKPYHLWLVDGLEYYGFRWKSVYLLYAGVILNKLLREAFAFYYECKGVSGRTYSLHGSCLIFGKEAIDKSLERYGTVFDENMFLLCEENELGHKALALDIPVYYQPGMKIKHFEDGSMNLLKNFDEAARSHESYLYFYEKWH